MCDPKTNGEELFYLSIKDKINVIFDVGCRSDSEFICFHGEVHYFDPVSEFYAPQTKILERRKRFRWVVLEALFILLSATFGLKVMKSASKTTHRNLFSTYKIFVWVINAMIQWGS